MTIIYGVFSERRPDGPPPDTPVFIVPLSVIEILRDASYRPPGVCHTTVVVSAGADVPLLDIAAGQKLCFGGSAPIPANIEAFLPFYTRPYDGIYDFETNRPLAEGAVFASIEETRAQTSVYPRGTKVVNLALPMS